MKSAGAMPTARVTMARRRASRPAASPIEAAASHRSDESGDVAGRLVVARAPVCVGTSGRRRVHPDDTSDPTNHAVPPPGSDFAPSGLSPEGVDLSRDQGAFSRIVIASGRLGTGSDEAVRPRRPAMLPRVYEATTDVEGRSPKRRPPATRPSLGPRRSAPRATASPRRAPPSRPEVGPMDLRSGTAAPRGRARSPGRRAPCSRPASAVTAGSNRRSSGSPSSPTRREDQQPVASDPSRFPRRPRRRWSPGPSAAPRIERVKRGPTKSHAERGTARRGGENSAQRRPGGRRGRRS